MISSRHSLVSCSIVGLFCGLTSAQAEVRIEAQELRSYSLPDHVLDLGGAQIGSNYEGLTIISKTTGDGASTACTVIIADQAQARAYTYQHNQEPTFCVGVTPGPEGGYFIRGLVGAEDDHDEVPSGFTALINAEGEEVWFIHDQELVDADAYPPGSGSFLGLYERPHPVMAYSPQFNRLLSFTVGALQLGIDTRELTQAHVVSVASGHLRVSGQRFGQSSVGLVGGAVTRASDGLFLLYMYSLGSQGANFFTYNGDKSVSAYQPLGEDWSSRFVVPPLTYGPDNYLHLLWTPTDAPDTETRLTVVDDNAERIWSQTWPAEYSDSQLDLNLGPPARLWVGVSHSLILYSAGGDLYLRVIDVTNGRSLGVAPVDGLTPHAPIEILTGEEGRLKLLTLDEVEDKLVEYELEFFEEAGPEPGVDAGLTDAGLADVNEPDAQEAGRKTERDEGCGCAGARAKPDAGSMLMLMLVGLFVGLRRQRQRR